MHAVILALAVYRLAALFVEDIGPFRMFERLRLSRLNKATGQPLSCIRCMSVYCALFVYVLPPEIQTPFVTVMALSAGVLLIDLAKVWVFK